MPPSTRTANLSPAASTIGGRARTVDGTPSNCRPPWFETTIPSAPTRRGRPRILVIEDAFDDELAGPVFTNEIQIAPCDPRVEIRLHPSEKVFQSTVRAEDRRYVAELMRPSLDADVPGPARMA